MRAGGPTGRACVRPTRRARWGQEVRQRRAWRRRRRGVCPGAGARPSLPTSKHSRRRAPIPFRGAPTSPLPSHPPLLSPSPSSPPPLSLSPHSPARVHPPGHPGHGRPVPSQVGHGQDRRLCPVRAATAGAGRRRGRRHHRLPHPGAGVPGEARRRRKRERGGESGKSGVGAGAARRPPHSPTPPGLERKNLPSRLAPLPSPPFLLLFPPHSIF